MGRRLGVIVLLMLLSGVWMPVMAQDCSSQDVEAWRTQANNDYGLENYEEAIAGYTCMIEVSDEQDAFAYEWRGVSKRLLGQNEEALRDINRSIEMDPTRGGAYYSRGNTYLALDEYERAIADYETAVENGYSNAYVYNNWGFAYMELDDIANAKPKYDYAVRLDPEYGLGYSNLGYINFLEGDLDAALENFASGIRYSSGIYKAYAHLNRGDLDYFDRKYTDAIGHYTSGVDADNEYEALYLARGRAYQAIQSPNANADYLRYIQTIQGEIVDLGTDANVILQEPLEMVEGRVYRVTLQLLPEHVLSVSASAAPDSEVDPLILLLGTTGSPIFADDDSGSDKDAVINRFPIAQEGTYTLLVTHSDQGDTGEVILNTIVTEDRVGQIIPYQLAIGEPAEIFAVSNEGPGIVNLRQYPSLGFEVLDLLDSGSRVTVINGPYKGEDYVWWQVETDDGTQGWVVENISDIQTLYPAIDVGRTVAVNVPELNFRAEPTVDGELIQSLFREAPVLLTVIEGPVEADGFRWWKVRFPSGVEGWAVDRVEDNQTLIVILDS